MSNWAVFCIYIDTNVLFGCLAGVRNNQSMATRRADCLTIKEWNFQSEWRVKQSHRHLHKGIEIAMILSGGDFTWLLPYVMCNVIPVYNGYYIAMGTFHMRSKFLRNSSWSTCTIISTWELRPRVNSPHADKYSVDWQYCCTFTSTQKTFDLM